MQGSCCLRPSHTHTPQSHLLCKLVYCRRLTFLLSRVAIWHVCHKQRPSGGDTPVTPVTVRTLLKQPRTHSGHVSESERMEGTVLCTYHGDPAERGDGLADRGQVVEERGAAVLLAELLCTRDLVGRRLQQLHQHRLQRATQPLIRAQIAGVHCHSRLPHKWDQYSAPFSPHRHWAKSSLP